MTQTWESQIENCSPVSAKPRYCQYVRSRAEPNLSAKVKVDLLQALRKIVDLSHLVSCETLLPRIIGRQDTAEGRCRDRCDAVLHRKRSMPLRYASCLGLSLL